VVVLRPRGAASRVGGGINREVLEFTRRALEHGLSREQIAQALKRAGWTDADIRTATGAFADIDIPAPVPKPRPYLSAQEVFTYALFFTALYVCVFNVGAIAFQFIDVAFPDPARGTLAGHQSINADNMRRNLPSLIVAFPLFVFLLRAINRAISNDPSKRSLRPRKWMTYLTLFVAAATLMGD
jgi:hypothetical protein